MIKTDRVDVLTILNHHQLSLGSIESFTGGMFASSVIDIPGASLVFNGAIVTYANKLKQKLALVDEVTIEQSGAISSKTAMEMARGGQKQLEVDVCLAFTGNAGPDANENKPVGDVYIAIAYQEVCIVEHFNFTGTRDEIREEAVIKGWEILERVTNERKEHYL